MKEGFPDEWGKFLRYRYAIFDFSDIKDPGIYTVSYGEEKSESFRIAADVYKKDVWQPTLEIYFPVQMCHVKVRDRSLIWHGACHLDDALQAPPNTIHVDQYRQYEGTETKYPVQTTVPFLNQGGWHDAGDDDLAAGSQAGTTHYLVLAYELNKDQTDQTSVNFEDRYVEMYKPDEIPDFVQQRPAIWGIGWNIQEFALQHYYLVEKYSGLFDREEILKVVNYVLGCHPGSSTSLVSGVEAHSITVAFRVNRTMEGYIPGGMVSGTALIRPDFPELKETTPYLWQQSEYVMSGAATYIFCVKSADKLLNKN